MHLLPKHLILKVIFNDQFLKKYLFYCLPAGVRDEENKVSVCLLFEVFLSCLFVFVIA